MEMTEARRNEIGWMFLSGMLKNFFRKNDSKKIEVSSDEAMKFAKTLLEPLFREVMKNKTSKAILFFMVARRKRN